MSPQIFSILVNAADLFFRLLSFLIIVRIFMSWLAPGAVGRLAYFITSTTEPVLGLFRRLPLRLGPLDLSPLVALLALDLLHMLVLNLLFRLM